MHGFSNSLGNTTGNYITLYSVIYILRNFCNVLQYETQNNIFLQHDLSLIKFVSLINHIIINY